MVSAERNAPLAPRNIDLDPSLHISFEELGPPANSGFHFVPEGKSLAFVIADKGVDNVWIQPLDGSKGHQLTHFNSGQITDFRWAPDGKTLAVLRFHSTSDVILLHDSAYAQP